MQHCDSRSKSYDVYLGAIKMSVLGSSARLSQHKDRDQAKHQAVSKLDGGQIFPDCHPRLAVVCQIVAEGKVLKCYLQSQNEHFFPQNIANNIYRQPKPHVVLSDQPGRLSM